MEGESCFPLSITTHIFGPCHFASAFRITAEAPETIEVKSRTLIGLSVSCIRTKTSRGSRMTVALRKPEFLKISPRISSMSCRSSAEPLINTCSTTDLWPHKDSNFLLGPLHGAGDAERRRLDRASPSQAPAAAHPWRETPSLRTKSKTCYRQPPSLFCLRQLLCLNQPQVQSILGPSRVWPRQFCQGLSD